MTPIEQLSHIIPALNGVVDRIWYGQLDAPTPCAKFTVHDVLDHMIVGGGTFAPLFRGETPPEVKAPAVYGWVPAAEFTATMEELLSAVRVAGSARPGDPQSVRGGRWRHLRPVRGVRRAHPRLGPGAGHRTGVGAADRRRSRPSTRSPVRPSPRRSATARRSRSPPPKPAHAGPLEHLVAFSGRTV